MMNTAMVFGIRCKKIPFKVDPFDCAKEAEAPKNGSLDFSKLLIKVKLQ